MTDFSLAHLTVLGLPPPQVVDVAARTGYRYVGFRLIAVTPETPGYRLMDDKAAMRETKARTADTKGSACWTSSSCGSRRRRISRASAIPSRPAPNSAPKSMITAAYDTDRERLIERYGALCRLAAPSD